jgi:murein DD-endopeptidase MepM/ murein hydrolase activator NlpD
VQILITHGVLARNQVLQISRTQVVLGALLAALLLILFSGAIYHYFFLKAAREGWPVVSHIVKLVVRDEIAQRDRFMRENLDAMAQRVGEMQAKLVKLEAMGDRVAGLAGVKGEDLRPLQRGASAPGGGKGGLYLPLDRPSLPDLQRTIEGLDLAVDRNADILTLVESRLLEARLAALLVPSSAPVDGPVGSGFGFRHDPITGRAALHTGLDFPAEVGTPVRAAAGGVVVASEWHPQYGRVLEIDHGSGLTTLYAHASKISVQPGDIVRRGQIVAEVGNTGRSTGPHLHFEVLVDRAPQDPARFLASGTQAPSSAAADARAPASRRR